jgi:hypothetical protein
MNMLGSRVPRATRSGGSPPHAGIDCGDRNLPPAVAHSRIPFRQVVTHEGRRSRPRRGKIWCPRSLLGSRDGSLYSEAMLLVWWHKVDGSGDVDQ